MLPSEVRGKTIAAIEWNENYPGSGEVLRLRFTDGACLRFTSWDYEGYSSGLNLIHDGEELMRWETKKREEARANVG